jgi:predicted SnoaL-like aldol condensation-catalyzing enzyme
MITQNKQIIINYINEIWNKNLFEKMDHYIHSDFVDHSLPLNLPTNKEGLKLWILGTGKSFEHETTIDEMVAENDKVIIKIRMKMKHIGIWRDIEPTNAAISIIGYRNFTLKDTKIVAHWALIDGNSIENQIMNAENSCKIQE